MNDVKLTTTALIAMSYSEPMTFSAQLYNEQMNFSLLGSCEQHLTLICKGTDNSFSYWLRFEGELNQSSYKGQLEVHFMSDKDAIPEALGSFNLTLQTTP